MKKKSSPESAAANVSTAPDRLASSTTAPLHEPQHVTPAPPAPATHAPPREHRLQRNGTPSVARQWKTVVLITAASTLLAWLFAFVQPDVYRAASIAAVTPLTEGLDAEEVLRGVDTLERRTLVATIAALASTPVTRRQAAGGAFEDYEIDAIVLPNTNLLRVTVEGADANRVAAIANRIPEIIAPQTRAMYKLYGVTIVSPATPPEQPALPRVGRTVAAGLLLGLIVGAIVAYNTDRRRTATR